MGELANRIARLELPLNAPQSVLDELAAIAARAEIIELECESLAAINARVEQENDLLSAGLLEAIEEIETLVRLEWSRSPLGGHESDDRWKLAQRLRLLANPSTPSAAADTVKG